MSDRPRGRPRSRSRSGDRGSDRNFDNRNRRDERNRYRDSDRDRNQENRDERYREDRRESFAGGQGRNERRESFNSGNFREDRRQSFSGAGERNDFRGGGRDYGRQSMGNERGGHRGGHYGHNEGNRNYGENFPRSSFQNRGPQSSSRANNENIELHTNYFRFISTSDWTLYQYRVDFEPMIESKRLRIGLMKMHNGLFPNHAFDGEILYILTRLPNDPYELESVRNFDQKPVKIKLRFVSQITPRSNESIRIMNIVFKKCLNKCELKEFGREKAYFDFNSMHDIKHGIKIVPGYKASINYYGNSLLLCTEIAHKMVNNRTILEDMEDLYRQNRDSLDDYRQKCYEKLIGNTLMTGYNRHKTYRIDDIAWDITPNHKFLKADGTSISYAQYYLEAYQIKIKNLNQPLLTSLPKEKDKNRAKNSNEQPKPIYFIPELCLLTGNVLLREFAKNFSAKRDFDEVTKLNPNVRVDRLRNLISTINQNDLARNELESWSTNIERDLVKCNALVLKSETIEFRNRKSNETERGWNNLMKDSPHLETIPLKNWFLFYLQRDESRANFFMREVMNLSRPMGFQVDDGRMYMLPSGNTNTILFTNAIKEVVRNNNPQMIVCLLPNTNKDTYDAIKSLCCVDLGIPSQCITSNILDQGKIGKAKSAITKIAIQMNCKLGGVIWGLQMPLKNIMIVGIDIYKDSAKRNQSVAAFVASTNGNQEDRFNCTKYFSRCVMQARGQDYIDSLELLMNEALNRYFEKNKTYPDRIFVYRDGVSDGQFQIVKDYEIEQIKRAFSTANLNYNPKLFFLIVKKRGNSRFFYEKDGAFINPPMGTVIDNTVVKQDNEFYLISQSTDKGTVSPTHFHVIEKSEDKVTLDKLQILTYKLTHLYYNWPGQIRSPGVVQYATKLAHLVGESIHRPHAPNLDDKLFYL